MISNKVQYTYIHFSYENEIGGVSFLNAFNKKALSNFSCHLFKEAYAKIKKVNVKNPTQPHHLYRHMDNTHHFRMHCQHNAVLGRRSDNHRYLLATLYALLGCAVITGIHVYQYIAWGKREFTLRSALHNRDLPSRLKLRASHPAVPEKYLAPAPTGYFLGRAGQKYVRILPSQDSFCALVCSSPGSGKSVTMMSSLLANYTSPHRSFLTIATDPKGELSEKFADLPDIKIISLSDREKYGYDPFYWYKPSMSDEDMEPFLKAMAEALVSDSGGERNQYFWANARKILIDMMAWLIRKVGKFPAVMTAISTHDVMSLIDQALDESGSKLVKKMLSSFSGKTGEDMQSIQTEVTTSIDVFAAS